MAAAFLVATHLRESIGLGWMPEEFAAGWTIAAKGRRLYGCLLAQDAALLSVPGSHEHGPADFAGSEDLTRQGATKKRHEWAEKFQEEARGGGLRSDSVGRLNEPGSKRVAFKREAKDGISVQLLTRAHLRRPFSELSVPEPETKMNVIPG